MTTDTVIDSLIGAKGHSAHLIGTLSECGMPEDKLCGLSSVSASHLAISTTPLDIQLLHSRFDLPHNQTQRGSNAIKERGRCQRAQMFQ